MELDWYFYFYGPYDKMIEDAISRSSMFIEERPGTTSQGRAFRCFRSLEREQVDLDPTFDWMARSVIDDQWRAWADANLNELLSHVYFETEPMVTAEPMEHLDFSGIRPRPRVKSLGAESMLSPDALTRLRRHLAERNSEREAERQFHTDHGRPLSTTLREAYDHAVDVLEKEGGVIPSGLEGQGPTWREAHSEA